MNDNLIVTYRDIAITYDEQKDKWFFTHRRQGHREQTHQGGRAAFLGVSGQGRLRTKAPALLLLGQVNCRAAGRPSSEGGLSLRPLSRL